MEPAADERACAQTLADLLGGQRCGLAIPSASRLQEHCVAFDEDAMVIQQILEEPRDEKDLDKCLGGPSHPSPYLWEADVQLVDDELYSPTRDGIGMTLEIFADPRIKDYLESSLLEFCEPKEGWGGGRRGSRKKRTSPWEKNYLAFDEEAMVIQKILEEPRDEKDLDKCLGGPSDPSPCLWEANVQLVQGKFYSPARDDGIDMKVEIFEESKLKDYCDSSLLEYCKPMEGWGGGRRGSRKRRTSPWKLQRASGSREYKKRKNNEHWTPAEVKLLLKGISKYGVGRWAELQRNYFLTSIRTSVNLKDKWRNLLEAYTSNKKEKQQKYVLLPLEEPLVAQIRELAAKYPYPIQSHTQGR
ncbi:hypothetical protein ACP70R_019186 [Stipagrostis hirtigluma subsp. patula]